MDQLIRAASDWPVIFQGALGSALFWAFLKLMGWLVASVTKLLSEYSSAAATEKKRAELIFHKNIRGQDAVGYLHAIYRALGYLFTAMAWVVGGITIGNYFNVFYIIGLFGALIYLFRGMAWIVPPVEIDATDAARWQRVARLEAELDGAVSPHTQQMLSAHQGDK